MSQKSFRKVACNAQAAASGLTRRITQPLKTTSEEHLKIQAKNIHFAIEVAGLKRTWRADWRITRLNCSPLPDNQQFCSAQHFPVKHVKCIWQHAVCALSLFPAGPREHGQGSRICMHGNKNVAAPWKWNASNCDVENALVGRISWMEKMHSFRERPTGIFIQA